MKNSALRMSKKLAQKHKSRRLAGDDDNKSKNSSDFGIGPEFINVRFKMGILQLDDVNQSVKVDFNIFFYYDPVTPIPDGDVDGQNIRFENTRRPAWVPHFDFANEYEEMLVTNESYWLDNETGRVFGKLNYVPSLQENFDHRAFPYDRQIANIQLLMDNCRIKPWDLKNLQDFPPELQMHRNNYVVQCELNAAADAWKLTDVQTFCINDEENKSSILHVQVFLERYSQYYFWNILVVYFMIIVMKAVLYAFPYDHSRFEFGLTLALTIVAFKFVISELVPKTTYLTYLDLFMQFGLALLVIRVAFDFTLQTIFEDELPLDNEGNPGHCRGEDVDTLPCTVDFIMTTTLFLIWVALLLFAGACVVFPSIIRPSWKSLDKKHGKNVSKNLKRSVVGMEAWIPEERKIEYFDLDNYQNSSRFVGPPLENPESQKALIDRLNTMQQMNTDVDNAGEDKA